MQFVFICCFIHFSLLNVISACQQCYRQNYLCQQNASRQHYCFSINKIGIIFFFLCSVDFFYVQSTNWSSSLSLSLTTINIMGSGLGNVKTSYRSPTPSSAPPLRVIITYRWTCGFQLFLHIWPPCTFHIHSLLSSLQFQIWTSS